MDLDYKEAGAGVRNYGYYCTVCDLYMVASCEPMILTPRLLEHALEHLDSMWWTKKMNMDFRHFRQTIESLTLVGKLALLTQNFSRLREFKADIISALALEVMKGGHSSRFGRKIAALVGD